MFGPLARLGDTSVRLDQRTLDRWARGACVVGLVGYTLHALYAVTAHRALYGDAAWFLLRMITEGDVTSFYTDFTREFYYSRFVSYSLTQLPTLVALHLGMDDARQLSWILGATYFLHKPASLWLCFRLLPTGRKAYILFPMLGLFAGSINSEVYIVTETHLATSFLWPLLISVTQLRNPGAIASSVIAAGFLLSAFVYESMAFFGPVLMLVCLIRAAREPGNHRGRWLWLASSAAVPIVMSWAAIIFPRDPTNKSAFSNGVFKLLEDSMAGLATVHVLGFISILALLGIVGLLAWALFARGERTIPWWTWVTALALAGLPAIHFMAYAASVDFTYAITDRGFGGLVMQVLVVGLYLLVLVLPTSAFRIAVPGAMVLVSALAIGQVTWQLLATHAWHGAIQQLEGVLTTTQGLNSCTSTRLADNSLARPRSASILCHWWVLPLSVVLAPDSGVRALVRSQEPFLPFDPNLPNALPNSPASHIDYRPYLRAWTETHTGTIPRTIDFTAAGDGSRYFRAGFSSPESWATWTDGEAAKMELCFGRPQGDPVLSFRVAPQVTAIRPRLEVAVNINGTRMTEWVFDLGEAVVNRQVTIPRGQLGSNGCATVGFTFDDHRRASEIGVPDDPRRLGLAFVSMHARF